MKHMGRKDYSLFDAKNGGLLAMMEAGALGQMRTSAIAGVATPWGGVSDDERLLVEALVCGVLFLYAFWSLSCP